MIVPFPNTAASDALSRILGERLSHIYGQQLVVDNRPVAGGLIGSELIRSSAPDGYTFGMVGQPHLSNVLMRDPKPYDPLNDFASVGLVGVTPNVIVLGKGVEAKTIPELIKLARAKPGALNYGSAGVGTYPHLDVARFLRVARIEMTHVPYKSGGAGMVTGILGNEVQLIMVNLASSIPQIRAGRIKALATT